MKITFQQRLDNIIAISKQINSKPDFVDTTSSLSNDGKMRVGEYLATVPKFKRQVAHENDMERGGQQIQINELGFRIYMDLTTTPDADIAPAEVYEQTQLDPEKLIQARGSLTSDGYRKLLMLGSDEIDIETAPIEQIISTELTSHNVSQRREQALIDFAANNFS